MYKGTHARACRRLHIIGRLNLVNKKGMHACVNGRLSEQKNLMSHMKCKQKGVNGKW